MEIFGLLVLFAFGGVLGVCAAWEYGRRHRSDRESRLHRQLYSLNAALAVAQHAFEARTAMHAEADRLRHEASS